MKIEMREIRHGFGDGLLAAARENADIYALSADLAGSLGFDKIKEELPKQYVECGIAEQNMACVASGLAAMGKKPFIGSFSAFNPGRNWEQIRTTIALNDQNVKIVGSHAGFSDSTDGATHQALEDIATTRVIPNLEVYSPADYNEAFALAKYLATTKKPAYIRIMRGEFPKLFPDNYKFAPQKLVYLQKPIGKNRPLVLSTGAITHNVREALEGLNATHIHIPTIKPLNAHDLYEYARDASMIITVEEHQIAGGFGSAIVETFAPHLQIPVHILGVKDQFGESGAYDELLKKHRLDAGSLRDDIARLARTR